MCAETTLLEFATSLVYVISCEPVNVETERDRNFSTLEAQYAFTEGNRTINPVPIFLPTCIGTSLF